MEENNNQQKTNELHIGQRIKEELARQGRTITWLAQEMECTRDNLYKIFRHQFINTELLLKISRAMKHDFFKEYSDILNVKMKSHLPKVVNKKV